MISKFSNWHVESYVYSVCLSLFPLNSSAKYSLEWIWTLRWHKNITKNKIFYWKHWMHKMFYQWPAATQQTPKVPNTPGSVWPWGYRNSLCLYHFGVFCNFSKKSILFLKKIFLILFLKKNSQLFIASFLEYRCYVYELMVTWWYFLSPFFEEVSLAEEHVNIQRN